jgi:FMN-dependent oxidoreductase (nitrilotriacetate monooxygenase family)
MGIKRQMHLVAYLKTGPTANHMGAWRHPDSEIDNFLSPAPYEHIARVLEAGCFDACFFADGLGLHDIYKGGYQTRLQLGGQNSFLDPLAVLPYMARVTRHLGIGTTLSTTFHQPYSVARMLASLDILSGGRIAWNVVTSTRNEEARNFGGIELPPRELRYDMADEFVEACMALWSCWEDDTFVLDKNSGVLVDASKVKYADFNGKWFKTRGPLSVPRSPQGHPVIMQAGASDRGREFAARWAEIVFVNLFNKSDMLAFRSDLRARAAAMGRDPDGCAVLPYVTVLVGETDSIAKEKALYLNSLAEPELVLAANSSNIGVDLSADVKNVAQVEKDRGTQGMQGALDRLDSMIKGKGLDFKEAVRQSDPDMVVGTPNSIADHLQDLFESGACDGFVVSPLVFPASLEQFCRAVVPELQRRGVFRSNYSGRTLRDNLRGTNSHLAAA